MFGTEGKAPGGGLKAIPASAWSSVADPAVGRRDAIRAIGVSAGAADIAESDEHVTHSCAAGGSHPSGNRRVEVHLYVHSAWIRTLVRVIGEDEQPSGALACRRF